MSNEIVEKVKTILTKSEISFELVEGVFHFPLDLENVKLSRIQVELAVAADSIIMHSCLGVNAPRGRFLNFRNLLHGVTLHRCRLVDGE